MWGEIKEDPEDKVDDIPEEQPAKTRHLKHHDSSKDQEEKEFKNIHKLLGKQIDES